MLRTKTVRHALPAPATILRKIASFAAVLKVAQRDWGWIESSPLAQISKPSAGRGRVRFLSAEERERLLSACKESSLPTLHAIVILAISTGMRLGEIMSLRWELVDVQDRISIGHAQLLKTKNGERRGVSIAGAALAELRTIRRAVTEKKQSTTELTGLLFPSQRLGGKKSIDIRRPWKVAVAKSGLVDFRFHDLRHSAASYLAMNGATPSEIAEILGHKTLSMVKRYAHLSPAHTAMVVERMNAEIFGQGVQ